MQPDRAGVSSEAIRFLHLTEDLGLPDKHGIQACRYSKDVADGLGVVEAVKMFGNRVRRNAGILANEVAELVARSFGEDLDAIACRQDHRIRGLRALAQRCQRSAQLLGRDREPFSNLDGSRFVTNANYRQLHFIFLTSGPPSGPLEVHRFAASLTGLSDGPPTFAVPQSTG